MITVTTLRKNETMTRLFGGQPRIHGSVVVASYDGNVDAAERGEPDM